MKVLILTISAGHGHNQTSMAACEMLKEYGADCIVLDAYDYIHPILSKSVEKGYLFTTRYTPVLYGGFYRLAEKKDQQGEVAISRVMNKMMAKKLIRFINSYSPDVIIATHIFAAQCITDVRKYLVPHKSIGIITDFTVHPFWEDTDLDYYVTPTHLLNNQCRKKGISLDKVLPIGIPIHKKFSKKISKSEARKILNIKDKPTILVMMGSMGYGNVTKIVSQMDNLENDFQILCVCGNNKHAKAAIERRTFRHDVYTFGFVDNVDIMMDASDFIVTKPGGLTVSESLAKGLPMILVNPIPGQEDRNLEFLLNNGLSMYVTSTFPIDEAVYQLLSNKERLALIEVFAKNMGKPNAAKDLAEFVLSLKNEKKVVN
ncbi:MAG: glycosyltransferase [Clostridiaceae bacterium]|nr:glycosyltransferase [Clostridiaceae bacterium]